MKILCVSDYHREERLAKASEKLAEKEKVDVVINAGDYISESFAKKVLDRTKFRTFTVKGNWDNKVYAENRKVTVLENEIVEYKDYHFLGVDWGFYSQITKLAKGVDPKKLILITHDPPFDILDLSYFGGNAGHLDLRAIVNQVKPALHVFGHIHEAAGHIKKDETIFVNAALPEYEKAVVVELPSGKLEVFDI